MRLGGLPWPGRILPTVGSITSDLLWTTVISLRSCLFFVGERAVHTIFAKYLLAWSTLWFVGFPVQHPTATQPTLSYDTSRQCGNRQSKNMRHSNQTLADTMAKHTHRSFCFCAAPCSPLASIANTSSNNTSSRLGTHEVKKMHNLHQRPANTMAKHNHCSSCYSCRSFTSGIEHQQQQHPSARSDLQTPAAHNTTIQPTPTPARRPPQRQRVPPE